MSEDQSVADTIWERLEECVQYLVEPFRASEIVGWFRRHYPDVKEQSLRTHIQGATSNASTESRGPFAARQPLITRIDRGLYRRFDGDPALVAPRSALDVNSASTQRTRTVDIETAVGTYLRDRDPNARYASFDYCFNHFQQHRAAVAGPAVSSLASTLPVGACFEAHPNCSSGASATWFPSSRPSPRLLRNCGTLDLDGYDADGVELVHQTAFNVRRALRPVEASYILVTKVMLGVFGCVPAFDTYFKKGFGVSTFSKGSLRQFGEFYRANASVIDGLRHPTLDFRTGEPTARLYTRAKVVDMVFFIEGGYRGSMRVLRMSGAERLPTHGGEVGLQLVQGRLQVVGRGDRLEHE